MSETDAPIAQWGVTDADEPLAPALNDIDSESKRKQEKIARREKATDINLKWIYGLVILGVLLWWEYFVISYSWELLNPDATKVRQMSDAVIIALWTSATANIVALPTIILNHLFPKRH